MIRGFIHWLFGKRACCHCGGVDFPMTVNLNSQVPKACPSLRVFQPAAEEVKQYPRVYSVCHEQPRLCVIDQNGVEHAVDQ